MTLASKLTNRVAQALAILLSGCGGGGGGNTGTDTPPPPPASYYIGVTVASVVETGESFTFSLDSTQEITIAQSDETKEFPQALDGGNSYSVSQTAGPRTCAFTSANQTGHIAANVEVAVDCGVPPGALAGKLRAPLGTQVVLQNNGADDLTVINDRTGIGSGLYEESSFEFHTKLATNAPYLVTLSSAPAGQACSVYQGHSGVMPVTSDSVKVGCEYSYDLLSRSSDDSVLSGNAYNVGGGVIGGDATTGEGRFVAFVSFAPDLAGSNDKTYYQVFWRDRQTGQSLLVSANASGTEGNGNSFAPAISADGQSVAFESYADNLATGDSNAERDIFVWSAANPYAGVQRVSVSNSGAQANGASDQPTISGDGKVVAFNTLASNLTSGVSDNVTTNIVRRDLTTRTNTLVTAVDGEGVGGSQPMLSEDGKRIAFWSNSSDLDQNDSNSLWDIFVYDHSAKSITRVSLTSTGVERNQGWDKVDGIVAPAISGDGRYVAYWTSATNVVPSDTNNKLDVFVVDTQTMVVVRASVDGAGNQGNGDSPFVRDHVTLSYDGHWVAFNTLATNLGPTAYNAVMHNIATGETRAVTNTSMTQTNAPSGLSMSRSGAYVSFDTLLPGGLDPRFSSSGMFARFTGVANAWWWT